jgi:hypothetical protein
MTPLALVLAALSAAAEPAEAQPSVIERLMNEAGVAEDAAGARARIVSDGEGAPIRGAVEGLEVELKIGVAANVSADASATATANATTTATATANATPTATATATPATAATAMPASTVSGVPLSPTGGEGQGEEARPTPAATPTAIATPTPTPTPTAIPTPTPTPTPTKTATADALPPPPPPPEAPTLAPAPTPTPAVAAVTPIPPATAPESAITAAPPATRPAAPRPVSLQGSPLRVSVVRKVEPDGRVTLTMMGPDGERIGRPTIRHAMDLPVLAQRRDAWGRIVRTVNDGSGSAIEVLLDPMGRFLSARSLDGSDGR